MSEYFYYISRDEQVDVIYNYIKTKVQEDQDFIKKLNTQVQNNLYKFNNLFLNPILPEDYPLFSIENPPSTKDGEKLYKKVALILHPDKMLSKYNTMQNQFQELFKILANAKDCLLNPEGLGCKLNINEEERYREYQYEMAASESESQLVSAIMFFIFYLFWRYYFKWAGPKKSSFLQSGKFGLLILMFALFFIIRTIISYNAETIAWNILKGIRRAKKFYYGTTEQQQ
jgi:hypothetical protein